MLEVKSFANLLGTPVSYAYALKAGPWVFLTGHEAYDWHTARVDEGISGPFGYPLFGHHHKSRREADFILNSNGRVDPKLRNPVCRFVGFRLCGTRRFSERPAPAMENIEGTAGMDATPRAEGR
jgi:hypothetical protein